MNEDNNKTNENLEQNADTGEQGKIDNNNIEKAGVESQTGESTGATKNSIDNADKNVNANGSSLLESVKLFIGIPISLGVVLLLFISYFVTQFHSLKKEQVTTWDAPMGIIFLMALCVCAVGIFIYVSLYVNSVLKNKEKKPLHKRIWYLALIVLTFIGIVLSLILNVI